MDKLASSAFANYLCTFQLEPAVLGPKIKLPWPILDAQKRKQRFNANKSNVQLQPFMIGHQSNLRDMSLIRICKPNFSKTTESTTAIILKMVDICLGSNHTIRTNMIVL
eukprot:1221173-Amphidinium_carterae.1